MKKFRLIPFLLSAVMLVSVGLFSACNKDKRQELTIMSWNLGTAAQNNLNRKMIAEFEKKYPDYKVTVVSYGNYTETLSTLAGKRDLPDVFMLDNLPTALINEWAADLSETVADDAEWQNVPQPLRESVRFNGRTFAIPAEMHLWGIFVNDTVFNENNVDSLSVNPSLESFFSAVDALNSPVKKVASLNDEIEMINWLPSAIDKSLGYYTFDGTKFNLASDAFASTLERMQRLRSGKKTFAGWSAQDKLATGFENVDELWYNNGLAMYFDTTASRNAKTYRGNELAFKGEMRFIGVPEGRSVIIPDMWAVSKSSENPQMAYELAKWLSFSKEGILKRIELDNASVAQGGKKEFISLPLSSDETVVSEFFKNETDGLKQVYQSIENAIVEPVKTVAGYTTLRWTLNTGKTYSFTERVNQNGVETNVAGTRNNATIEQIYDDVFKSQAALVWSDIKQELNTLVNNSYENASRALNAMYPKTDENADGQNDNRDSRKIPAKRPIPRKLRLR